jgi:filamentous hemagglutinin family protein
MLAKKAKCFRKMNSLHAIVFFWMVAIAPASSQIVPDATLPIDSSVASDGNTFNIKGGTSVGSNLFHSFLEFSVPTNTEAFFDNAPAIANIISRVTGSSISDIDGLIRANGNANLFLLNPNGIIFGSNARLDIGGSFLVSTAESLHFADGRQFNAKNPQTLPLLTVNIPIGLQFGENPGKVVARSRAINSDGVVVGLQVQPGKTLGLIGGAVILEGGYLTASQGRIELGSVGDRSSLELTPIDVGFALNYESVQNFQDIQLSQLAKIDTSGEGGGAIHLQGRQISILGGSQIVANTLGSQSGEGLQAIASESVKVMGTGPLDSSLTSSLARAGIFIPQVSLLATGTIGTGNGGNLKVQARSVIVGDGGQIEAGTAGTGKSGDLSIRATESVEVTGKTVLLGLVEPLRQAALAAGLDETFLGEVTTASQITTVNQGSGVGGNLSIETGRLIVRNGGLVTANPTSTGAGGNLTVNAAQSVELLGTPANEIYSPGLSTGSFGTGAAGDITITTKKLIVQGGSGIGTTNPTSLEGADIIVKASESVEVRGTSATGRWVSSLSADSLGVGQAGDAIVMTESLRVRDGAKIIVSSSGSGNSGTLQVVADAIWLDQGSLSAATASGEGGNINLQVRDILLLRDRSLISAEAGGRGNGGNITINGKFIVTVPQENSDIIANAFQGRGGNINITAQGLFGFEFQEKLTSFSDINASSEFGLDGVVEIGSPNVDPSRGLVKLPSVPGVPEPFQGCQARGRQATSSFINIGRGGLPPNPIEPLSSNEILEDVQLPASWAENSQATDTPHQIVEAQGWIVNEQGQVVLSDRVSPKTNVSCKFIQSAEGSNSEPTNDSGTTQL